MSRARWYVLIALVAIAGTGWIYITRVPDDAELATSVAAHVDFRAPNFRLDTLDGQSVSLSDLRGQVVLINFWATWCPPCRKEFPELAKAYDEHNGDFVILGVDLQESPGDVRRFADEYGAKFPIVIDADASVSKAYRLIGLPSSYFIDQNGVLRDQFFGPLSRATIDDKVEKARQAGIVGG